MSTLAAPEECRAYVAAHLASQDRERHPALTKPPAVTLSRQAGARGTSIGKALVERLRASAPEDAPPWTLFDESLVLRVLEDHNLPAELKKFMPDTAIGELEGTINEILGRHPSLWTLFEYTVETIVRLSQMGNCVLVGHGANLATRNFRNVLHVLLVGSRERRIAHMAARRSVDRKAAAELVKSTDSGRRKYVRKHFDADLDDPTCYDLVIDTDAFTDGEAVGIIRAALGAKLRSA